MNMTLYKLGDLAIRAISWCSVLLLLLLLAAPVRSQWQVEPQSVVTTVGSSVVLNCSANTEYVQWTYGADRATISINSVVTEVDQWHLNVRVLGSYNLLFPNVTRALDGTYNCEAVLLDVSKSVNLTVIGNPTTAIEPNLPSPFTENNLVSVNCSVADSNPPAIVSWLWASSAQLPPSVHRTDQPPLAKFAPSYSSLSWLASPAENAVPVTCIALNPLTNVTSSATFNISVQYRPRITVSVQLLYIMQGAAAMVSCNADANPNLVAWSWALPTSNGILQSASGNAVNLLSAQPENTGNYSCTGFNSVGQATATSAVYVLYAPVVSLPATFMVNETETISISCNADFVVQKSAMVQFTWYGPNGAILSRTKVLSLTASRDISGTYTCGVSLQLLPTYGAGKVVYGNASTVITVHYLPGMPSFSPALESSLTVSLGQSLSVNCVPNGVFPGSPHPQISWLSPNGTIQAGQMLRISSLKFVDEGNYTCVASNLLGRGQPLSINLKVIGSYLTGSPASQYFWEVGSPPQTNTLQCSACGRPMPSIQWFQNQRRIDLTNARFTISTGLSYTTSPTCITVRSVLQFQGSGRLLLNDLYASDFGNYTCNAMIESSPLSFDAATTMVYVSHAPIVSAPNQTVYALVGTQTQIVCRVTAWPSSVIAWSVQSTGESVTRYAAVYPVDVHTQQSELLVSAPAGIEPVSYVCSSSNAKGYGSAVIEVVRASVPDAPTNLAIGNITWEAATLSFVPGYNGSDVQTFFLFSSTVLISATNNTFVTLANLFPNRNYNIHIVASNRFGESAASSTVSFTTPNVLLPELLAAVYDRVSATLTLSTPNGFNLSNVYCMKLEALTNGQWIVAAPCIPFVSSQNYLPISNTNPLRVSACVVYRPDVCGDPVYIQMLGGSDIPDWLIYVVASVCTVIVLVLLFVLIIYCMRKRKRLSRDGASNKQKLEQPTVRPPQWMVTTDAFSPSFDGHTTQQTFLQVDGNGSFNADCSHVILSAACEPGPIRVRSSNGDNLNYLPFDGEYVQSTDILNTYDSCNANYGNLPANSFAQTIGQYDLRPSANQLAGHDRFSTFSAINNNHHHNSNNNNSSNINHNHNNNNGNTLAFTPREHNVDWAVPHKIVYEVVV